MRKKGYYTESQIERMNEIKKTLQSLIFPLVLCGIFAILVYAIIHYQNKEEEPEIIRTYAYSGDETPIVMETSDLKFEMDPTTTIFTITQKSTGKTWCSVAEDADNDGAALGAEKDLLKSNLLITYSIVSGLDTPYNSYGYSIKNGIYEIEASKDEVKVFYSMGNVEKEYVIPPVITEARLNSFLANMEEKAGKDVKEYYKKYDINKLGKKDNKEELLENYPIIETEIIYVLRSNTKPSQRKKMEGIFEAAGYTYEDYIADKELDMSTSTSETPVFNVEMDFKLEGNDLVVEIPYKSIEYPSKSPIYNIAPLPFFGAANKQQEGFMLVPEGGGAMINYNNGKVSQNAYYANVYGWDYGLSRDAVVHNTRAYFNCFGQGTEGSSYLCFMEDGVSYAGVQADISGRTNSYNRVNAVYTLCSREKYDVGNISSSDVYVYLSEFNPEDKIVQRYRFLGTDNYVQMAEAYRDYLQERSADQMVMNTDTEAPVSFEIVGAIDKVRQILGVPVSRPFKLTTFKEAAEMMDDLSANGVHNASVKLTGWCNGGVQQKILKHVKLVSALGGASNLKKLAQNVSNMGGQLYLNGITQNEHNSNIFDGFFKYSDAAKFLSKELAKEHQYSHITYAEREHYKAYYMLHTELAVKMAENLQKASDKYSAGVSFEDTGMDLSSDFYRKNYYSREAVRNIQVEQLASMKNEGEKIMINMGNDYALPYVDMITNMDLKGSEYTILDQMIPFYQIAIHGYVNYTGKPLNICGNEEEELLQCVEYGAGLNFTLMKESSFALQKTLYPEYYGSSYEACSDRVISLYTRYNQELGHTFNQKIVNHTNISPELTCTEYEDGTKVYVNYSFSDEAKVGGVVVGTRDYAVVR